jgi:uncharacterized SAM-binding protein YcdF (DUF218 family)
MLYGLRLLMVAAIGASLWLVGLILFTHLIPIAPQEIMKKTDGIVVFTGGDTRLAVALDFFQQQRGKYLLISGVNPDSTSSDTLKNLSLQSRITLGYEALDTVGNAEETAAWAHDNHIKSLRLITSNYHMPRSLFELRHVLPEIQIISHAVVGESFLKPKWWLQQGTLSLVIQEYNKFLFSLMRRPLEDIHHLLLSIGYGKKT